MTRTHAFLAFLALAILRVAVGYHFFKEGQAKLESGDFKSEYFLSAAKGPWADDFKSLLDDPDGLTVLNVKSISDEGETPFYQVDPSDTFAAWDQFVDKASSYYGFGSEDLRANLIERRKTLGNKIRKARKEKDQSVDTRSLEIQREQDAEAITQIPKQQSQAEDILQDHKDMLASWLRFNDTEIVSHFGTLERLKGFKQDGINRTKAGSEVESLREQIYEIGGDRKKKLNGWKTEVSDIWNSLEQQINDLAVADQAERSALPLERPYAPSNSMGALVDKYLPWFDLMVGSLLIIGLFTRLTSLAGAIFLLSVLATQPPWVPGVTLSGPGSVCLYIIEFAALLVIFATCAGRNFGLDYLVHSFFTRKKTSPSVEAGASL